MKDKISKIIYSKKVKMILLLLLVIYLIPFLYSISLSIPSLDDFAFTFVKGDNLIVSAILDVAKRYNTWLGQWFSCFISLLINPLIIFQGFNSFYGIELCFIFLLFIFAVWLFLKNIFKYYTIYENSIFPILFVLLFCITFTNLKIYSQVLYWFCGSSYNFNVSLSLLLMVLIIKMFNNNKPVYYFSVSVFGFCLCSSFNVAAFPGLFYIILLISDYKKSKISLIKIIPLLFMIIGGLTGALAPGNFIRHSAMDSTGLHPLNSMFYTFADGGIILSKLIVNPFFMLFMVFCFYVGTIIKSNNVSFKHPVLCILSYGVLLFFLCFPVAFGYSAISFENRIFCFIDSMSLIWLMLCAVYIGGWCAYKNKGFINRNTTIIIISLLLIYLSGYYFFNEMPYVKTISSINQMERANSEWKAAYNYIENSKEEIVEVTISKETYYCPILNQVGVSDDPTNWINECIANYYGKKEIKFNIE